ncbi:PREDICTED: P protein-like [Drosophila arizonae]|uniref:P protein-like n=1 Tax=Drosophila arizonae TaxID=7263 RepID=A0ABM1NPK4_DROAR|nr:PREDICTED: P protein-like [Drosophila arizonae]
MDSAGNTFSNYRLDTEDSDKLPRKICNIVKFCLFLLVWLYSSVYLITTAPKVPSTFLVPVLPYRKYVIRSRDKTHHSDIDIHFSGPLDKRLIRNPEQATDLDPHIKVKVKSFNAMANETELESDTWFLFLLANQDVMSHTISKQFTLKKVKKPSEEKHQRTSHGEFHELNVILTNYHNQAFALFVVVNYNPVSTHVGVAGGIMLLIFLYVLIIWDLADRALVALLTSMGGMGLLCMMNARPQLIEFVQWIHLDCLMYVFLLMVIVSIVDETAVFDFIAAITYEASRGKPWLLVLILCVCAAIFSAILDNVTIILLMAPITLRLCQKLALCTTIVLMSVTMFANIGNVLSSLNKHSIMKLDIAPILKAQHITYGNYVLHLFPGVILSLAVAYGVLYGFLKKYLYRPSTVFGSITSLQVRADKLKKVGAHLSQYQNNRITQLRRIENEQIGEREEMDFASTLSDLKANCIVKNLPLLVGSCISLAVLFILCLPTIDNTVHYMTPNWIALFATMLLLILGNLQELDVLLARIDWRSLIFFAALLVLFKSIRYLGIDYWTINMLHKIVSNTRKDRQLAVSILVLTAVAAIESAIMPNMVMKSLMVNEAISMSVSCNLPFAPLLWSIAYGSSFGENSNLICSLANVITVGLAHQEGYRYSYKHFFMIGFPITVATLLISTLYLLIAHLVCNWHSPSAQL